MGGPDWTREYDPSGKLLNDAPNSRVNEMVFASAFGRAKGKLLDAFAFDDPIERERQIDAVVLTLVGLAFLEPDAHTILERLT
jgi:hypothetical protein